MTCVFLRATGWNCSKEIELAAIPFASTISGASFSGGLPKVQLRWRLWIIIDCSA